MANSKKENKSQDKKEMESRHKEKLEEEMKEAKKGGATPFLFLFTWVILGSFFFLGSHALKNMKFLLSENDEKSEIINNLQVENEVLKNKIEAAEKRIDKISIDMQVFAEKYEEKQQNLALKQEETLLEVEEVKEDVVAIEEAEIAQAAKEEEEAVQNAMSAEEYEKLAYDSQAISAGLNDVSDRTAFLEEKIDDVSEQLAQARLNTFSNNLVLSAVKLREAVKNSISFENELKAVKLFSQEDEGMKRNISILEEYAPNGVADITQLQIEFDEISKQILRLPYETKVKEGEDATLVDKAKLQFFSLVNVRKVDANATGDSTQDKIARAYNNLKNKDVHKALEEVSSLDGHDKVLVTPWINKAQAYVDSVKASEEIFVYVSDKVAAIDG